MYGNKVERGAESAMDKAASAGEKIQHKICNTAERTGEYLGEAVDETRRFIENARTGTVSAIRSNPIQSSLLALGIGVIAGLLMHRR